MSADRILEISAAMVCGRNNEFTTDEALFVSAFWQGAEKGNSEEVQQLKAQVIALAMKEAA